MICNADKSFLIEYVQQLKNGKFDKTDITGHRKVTELLINDKISKLSSNNNEDFQNEFGKILSSLATIHGMFISDSTGLTNLTELTNSLYNKEVIKRKIKSLQESVKSVEGHTYDSSDPDAITDTDEHFNLREQYESLQQLKVENKAGALLQLLNVYFKNDVSEFSKFTDMMSKEIVDHLFFNLEESIIVTPSMVEGRFYQMMDKKANEIKESIENNDGEFDFKPITNKETYQQAIEILLNNNYHQNVSLSDLYFFVGFKSFLEKKLFNITSLFTFTEDGDFTYIQKRESNDNIIIETSELNAEETSSSFYTHLIETTPLIFKQTVNGELETVKDGYLTKAAVGFLIKNIQKQYLESDIVNINNPILKLKKALDKIRNENPTLANIRNVTVANSLYYRFFSDNNSLYTIYTESDIPEQKAAALQMLTSFTHELNSLSELVPGVIEVDGKNRKVSFAENRASSGIKQRIFENLDVTVLSDILTIINNSEEKDDFVREYNQPFQYDSSNPDRSFNNAASFILAKTGLDLSESGTFRVNHKKFLKTDIDTVFKQETIKFAEKLREFYFDLISLNNNSGDLPTFSMFSRDSKVNDVTLFKNAFLQTDPAKKTNALFKAFNKNSLATINVTPVFSETISGIFDLIYEFSPKSTYDTTISTQSARLNIQSVASSYQKQIARIERAKKAFPKNLPYKQPTEALHTGLIRDIIKLDGSKGGETNLSHRKFSQKDNFAVNFEAMWLDIITNDKKTSDGMFVYFDPVPDSDKSLDAIVKVLIKDGDRNDNLDGKDLLSVNSEIRKFKSSIVEYYNRLGKKIEYDYEKVFTKETIDKLKLQGIIPKDSKIQPITEFDSFKGKSACEKLTSINEYLKQNNITSDLLTEFFSNAGFEAVEHIHGVFGNNEKDENPIIVQLNPIFLQDIENYKNVETFLDKQLENDVRLLQTVGITEFSVPIAFYEKNESLISFLPEGFKIDRKAQSVPLKLVNESGDINPLYKKFFYQWNVVSSNTLFSLAGPYFIDKGKTRNERFINSVKRMNGLVSPIKTYVTDIPGGLPKEIFELTMQDDKVGIQYPGKMDSMDYADGAAFGLASTARKEVNSLGGSYGTAPGMVVKDLNPAVDYETGVVSLDKRAKPTITNEMIRLTAGDAGPRDLGNVVKILYSADPKKTFRNGFTFTNEQVEEINNLHDIYKVVFDENGIKIEKAGIKKDKSYNSMYEIWEDLGGAYSVKKVHDKSKNFDFELNNLKYKYTDFSEVPETTKGVNKLLFPGDVIVEIEKRIDELNNSYLSNFIRPSSRKRGNKNVITTGKFDTLLSQINSGNKPNIPFSKQNQENAGVQMSTSKEYEDKELTLSTQSIGAVALGAYEPEDAQDMYLALKEIIVNGIPAEFNLSGDTAEFRNLMYKLLESDAAETTIGTVASAILDYAKANGILPSDHPQLFKNLNTKIAALISGDSIRQKLEGSQLVLIPTSKIIRTKNHAIDSNSLHKIAASPEKYPDVVKELLEKYKQKKGEKFTGTNIAAFLLQNKEMLQMFKEELKGAELSLYEDGVEKPFYETKLFKDLYDRMNKSSSNEEKTLIFKQIDAELAKIAEKAVSKKGDVYYDAEGKPIFKSSPGETIVPFIQVNAYKEYNVKAGMTIQEVREVLKNAPKSVREAFEAQLLSTNERIPLQSMASMMYNRAVGFLSNSDASGMVNNEHQKSTGGDFDVDKTNHSIYSVVKSGELSDVLKRLGLQEGDLIPFYGEVKNGKIWPSNVQNVLSKNFRYDSFSTFINQVIDLIETQDLEPNLKQKLITEVRIAANKNFLLFKKMAITSSPKTLTTRTTPVNMDDIETIVGNIQNDGFDIKTNLSPNSPASTMILKYQNQSAKGVVGIVAASLKSLALIQHSLGLVTKDPSKAKYLKTLPVFIKTGETEVAANGKEIPIQLEYKGLLPELNFLSENEKVIQQILLEVEGISFGNNPEINKQEINKVIQKYNNRVKNYDFLGELLNSAVDNAKELKLAIMNAGEQTVGLYIAFSFLGVNPELIGNIMNRPHMKLFVDLMSSNLYSKGMSMKDVLGEMSDRKENVSEIQNILLISENITMLSGLLGINQGLKSTGYQLYSYRNKLNNFYKTLVPKNDRDFALSLGSINKNLNPEQFSFEEFVKNKHYRELLIELNQTAVNNGTTGMNVFFFLSNSEHFREYFASAMKQSETSKKASFKETMFQDVVDMLHERKFINKDYLNEQIYNTVMKMIDELSISLYYDNSDKQISLIGKDYNLNNELERNEFIETMNTVFIPILKTQNQNNTFLNSLIRTASKQNAFGEISMNYRMTFDINNAKAEQQIIENVKYAADAAKLKEIFINETNALEALIHYNRLVNREGMNQESLTKFLPITNESKEFYQYLSFLKLKPENLLGVLQELHDKKPDTFDEIFKALSLKFNLIGREVRMGDGTIIKGNQRVFVSIDSENSVGDLRYNNEKDELEIVPKKLSDPSAKIKTEKYVSLVETSIPSTSRLSVTPTVRSATEIQQKVKTITQIDNIIVNC